jgi:hypothetical protein
MNSVNAGIHRAVASARRRALSFDDAPITI